jgi:hypothetical protein
MDNRTKIGKDLIRILQSKEKREIEFFTSQLVTRSGPITRSMVDRSTVGCRWWQLVYAILVTLPYDLSTLRHLSTVSKVTRVLDNIRQNKYHPYYQLFYNNQVIECSESNDTIPCVDPIDSAFFRKTDEGNFYGVIYADREDGSSTILHYFVLHAHKENSKLRWWISSSYGSEYVRIPVQTKEVSIEQLETFVEAITDPDSNREILSEFFTDYFLQGGLPLRFSEENVEANSSLRGKYIPSEIGIKKEIAATLDGRTISSLNVGVIRGLEDYVEGLLEEDNSMNGGNRPSRLTRRARKGRRTMKRVRRMGWMTRRVKKGSRIRHKRIQ